MFTGAVAFKVQDRTWTFEHNSLRNDTYEESNFE